VWPLPRPTKPDEPNTQAVPALAIVAVAKHQQTQRVAKENPTDLPAYGMRSDGLMINRLLPANGWQG
jgi:hypothetical protein